MFVFRSRAPRRALLLDGESCAGMNCDEIGHSFTVKPGGDPEHDRDNDGVACESQ